MSFFTIYPKNGMKIFATLSLTVLFLHTGTSVRAQSLIEKLGGANTDFVIATDYLTFEVEAQAIIKRGVNNVDVSGYKDEYGYGYGYGFQTWHLEFTTKGKVVEYYRKTREIKPVVEEMTDQDNSEVLPRFQTAPDILFYDLQFTDENDKVLLKIPLSESEVKIVSDGAEEDPLFTYSINLKKVPMVVLNRTKKIFMVSFRNFRKK